MDFAWLLCLWAAPFLISLTAGQDEPLTFSVQIRGGNSKPRQAMIGQGGIIACDASPDESGQIPTLAWYLDDVIVGTTQQTDPTIPYVVSDEGPSNLELNIDELVESHSGIAKCTGTLNGKTASASVELKVITDLEITSDPNQYGYLGEKGTLECKATRTTKKIWQFEDKTVIQPNEKYIMDQDSLTINELTFDDTKKYICIVKDFDTSEKLTLIIDFEVVDRPKIPVPPTIQPNNPKVGDEVKIDCNAEGTPQPTYQFKRGENTITSSEDEHVDESNGILTLKSITSDSEGKYVCVATNRGGTIESETTLDVKIPPMIIPIGTVGKAAERESRDIKCTAEGDPAPGLIWQKIGEAPISSTESGEGPHTIDEASTEPDDAKIKTVSKILRFQSVRPSDAGEYICKAINNAGTVNVTIDFEVLYAPHFDTDYKQTEFYGWRGHTANLTCMASANDLANFKWYLPSEESPNDVTKATQLANKSPYSIMTEQKFPDFHLSSSSLLVSLNDDETLYRDYMCEADNGQSTTRIITLKKASAPAPPTLNLMATHSTHASVEVTKPSDNGGQPVTSYSYKYYANKDPNNAKEGVLEGDDISGDKTVISIKSLDPSTSYVIEVQAGNVVDNSAFSQLTFETMEVTAPSRIVITSPKQGFEARSYKLTWAKPEDNGSPITRYTIKWQKVSVADEASPDLTISEYVGTKEEKTVEDNLDKLDFTISGLDSKSYYNVEILATNGIGDSVPGLRIIKTSAGAEDGKKEGGKDKETQEENKGGKEQASTNQAAAGLSSAIIIAIIVGIIIVVFLIVLIIYLAAKKRRQNSEGTGGEEEGGAKVDGKDQAEEEKLIKKDDAMQMENETGGDGEVTAVPISQPEEYEPDTKPEVAKQTEEALPAADTPAPDPAPAPTEQPPAEKPAEPAAEPTPAPTPEVKVTGAPDDAVEKTDAPTA